jgi:hypothetical protein
VVGPALCARKGSHQGGQTRCLARSTTTVPQPKGSFSARSAKESPSTTHSQQLIVRDGESRAYRLEAAGLVHQRQSKKGRVSWRCTDVGRGLVMEHRPVFLHRRGFPSYTLKSWQAMHGEGEVMEAA